MKALEEEKGNLIPESKLGFRIYIKMMIIDLKLLSYKVGSLPPEQET